MSTLDSLFFSSRRRHTRSLRDWSSDVCSSDLSMTIRAVAVGVEIAPTRKVVYQRALARQSFSDDSIHNDEYTRGKGYPGALVSAYVLAGYMSEPMVAFFGPSAFTTGRIDLTFIGR